MSSASHHGRVTPRRTGGGLRLDRWDLGFFAAVLVILVGSIVPLGALRQNLWNTPGVFFLGVGVVVPLVAAGLILSRGISGLDGPRVGSLTTEQFAHVASWLALAYFFSSVVTSLHPVFLIGLVGALGMVLTSPLRGVMARALASSAARRPRTAAGTSGAAAGATAEAGVTTGTGSAAGPKTGTPSAAGTPASGSTATDKATPAEQAGVPASDAVMTPSVAAAREEREQPEPERIPEPQPGGGATGAEADDELGQTRLRPRSTQEAEASATAAFGAPGTDLTDEPPLTAAPEPAAEPERVEEPVEEQAAPRGTEPGGYEAFWFAVGSRRDTVNPEDGSPAFTLEPGGWILALEDRGHEFLVQNTDGRTGVLRDLSDIERA